MGYLTERIEYFQDLVRRWNYASKRNDFQTIRDSQKALTQLGAYFNDETMSWELAVSADAEV